jgi:hypothetical protein
MNKTKPDDYVYTAIDAIDEVYYENKRKDEPKPSPRKASWNKLNGWQRFWLVSVVIQMVIIVLMSLYKMDFSFAFIMISIIVNLNCLLYGAGLATAYGLRRFKG